MRNLQPFVGKTTIAYRKGALNETDPLNRRLSFVHHATVPLFWDGDDPYEGEIQRKFHLLFDDAHLNLLTLNALRLSPDFVDLIIREGYSPNSFYGDEDEQKKDIQIGPQPSLNTVINFKVLL
jgi:hypothetical protein